MVEFHDSQFPEGSLITIAGVYKADTRSAWRKFIGRILRRPEPAKLLQEFRITNITTSGRQDG